MHPFRSLFLAALLCAPYAVRADESPKAFDALEETLQMEQKIDTARSAIIRVWLADKPHMAPYRDVIERFMRDYLSWEVLRDDFRREFAARFDDEELAEIERFYSTGPGRKLAPAIESILRASFADAKRRIVADQARLMAMIRAEAERIQELQKGQ